MGRVRAWGGTKVQMGQLSNDNRREMERIVEEITVPSGRRLSTTFEHSLSLLPLEEYAWNIYTIWENQRLGHITTPF